MQSYLNWAEMLVSIFLVVTVLLQVKGTGAGLFGGGGTTFRTRRGVEKTLFQVTIVLAVLFIIVSILSVRLV
ncbi:MAG: preprotein translocase subunit SecG [Chloroflexi bacterium]|nr:preprotein translocase subunit SecG [Chloroflexota bacterium]